MSTKEQNLKKFTRTAILANFIKKTNAEWNHEEWIALCDKIAVKYSPIDFNQVGLVLEEKRRKFLKK
ncbi:MAG: hypothetical protein KAG98_00425 [Lentisphaeria bacterium]|nr:hypothetical protein [Lentisphaeria bacterium]